MNGFLKNYEIYTSGNECPTIFHQWSALATMSSLVSGRVWTDGGVFTTFANMYIVLVGDPGSKKTTAMSLGHKIIAQFKKIAYAPASITKEAMIQLMAREESPCKLAFKYQDKPYFFAHLSIFASEFINLLNAGGNPIGMIDFFTDVWDRCDGVYRDTTKNKGDNEIQRPFISVLGCMTPETVRMLQSLKIISSGMTRRCVFVHGTRAESPIAFPDITPEQAEAFKACVAWGVKLQNVAGEFVWEPAARDIYKQFYDLNFARKHKIPSLILRQFLETKPAYIIKIAMLLWLSERTDALVLTAENITKAHKLISAVENGGALLFEGAGRNPLSSISQRIVQTVETAKMKIVNVKLIQSIFRAEASLEEIDKMLKEEQELERLSPIMENLTGLPGRWVTTAANYKLLMADKEAKKLLTTQTQNPVPVQKSDSASGTDLAM